MVVRLFVPPGEGQHYLVPARPPALGANATPQYVVLGSVACAAGYASLAAGWQARIASSSSTSASLRTALFVKAAGRFGAWAALAGAGVNAYYHHAFTKVVVEEHEAELGEVKQFKWYEWSESEEVKGQNVEAKEKAKGEEKEIKKEKATWKDKWKRNYTLDDGLVLGASVGLATFLPTLFLRRRLHHRVRIPWMTRALGLTNIGACGGILGAHAYLAYTGERQKAVDELDRLRRRRSLEFYYIFWDKLLMAKFSPVVQAYVRHNAVFRTYHLPAEVLEAPAKYVNYSLVDPKAPKETAAKDQSEGQEEAKIEEERYYLQSPDYTKQIAGLDVPALYDEIEGYRREKEKTLWEAEYIKYELSRKQHAFVLDYPSHEEYENEDKKEEKEMDDAKEKEKEDDRPTRIRELQLLGIAHNRLHMHAGELDRRIAIGNHWLHHRDAMDRRAPRREWMPRGSPFTAASSSSNPSDSASSSAPEVGRAEHDHAYHAHDPSLTLAEISKLQEQFSSDVKTFESRVASRHREDVEKRGKWTRDLEDARDLLRAADRLGVEMEERVAKRKVGLEADAKRPETEKVTGAGAGGESKEREDVVAVAAEKKDVADEKGGTGNVRGGNRTDKEGVEPGQP